MKEKELKIRELTILYEKLLKHIQELTDCSETIEDVKNNIECINKLNELHIETRNYARDVLAYDFSKLAPNPLLSFMFRDINKQSFLFINLITDYNERLIKYVKENDDVNLEFLIKDIKEFNEVAKKQFKPLKEKLSKLK